VVSWGWFLCKPKHVAAASIILICFNNSAFFTLCVLVGIIKWFISFMHGCNHEDNHEKFVTYLSTMYSWYSKLKNWAGKEKLVWWLLTNSTVQIHPYLRAIDHVSQPCKTTEIYFEYLYSQGEGGKKVLKSRDSKDFRKLIRSYFLREYNFDLLLSFQTSKTHSPQRLIHKNSLCFQRNSKTLNIQLVILRSFTWSWHKNQDLQTFCCHHNNNCYSEHD
jgi:hypothetical protein